FLVVGEDRRAKKQAASKRRQKSGTKHHTHNVPQNYLDAVSRWLSFVVLQRQLQLPDRPVAFLDCLHAMAAEIVIGVLHLVLRLLQRPYGRANSRMPFPPLSLSRAGGKRDSAGRH
ncbi:MAG TPA: hypothetical protein VEU47_19840, partial [Candidatus Cybelea sp.]|nr:hypothetical protein [Candidatus Cybelea sp.]